MKDELNTLRRTSDRRCAMVPTTARVTSSTLRQQTYIFAFGNGALAASHLLLHLLP